jgi:hypothetical protein
MTQTEVSFCETSKPTYCFMASSRHADAARLENSRRLGRIGSAQQLRHREQVSRLVGCAMKRKPSPDFCGYWQRHIAA